MAGGGSGNSTVTNKTELDPITQQWRGELYGDAKSAYQQGAMPFYPGSTVVPFSQQTQAGLGMLQNQAQQGATNYGAANDAASRALSGYNPAMGYAMNAAGGGLANNPFAQQTATAANQQTTQGVSQLQNIADGGGNNPHLDSLFNSMSGKVSDAVNANFARAGRSGPNAAHTGALTDRLGALASSIYTPAFEAQQGRAMSAAGQLAGIQQGDRSMQMQGLGQAGSLYDSGQNRTLTGAGLAGDIWTQGNQDAARTQALLPSIWNYGAQPGQQLLGVGGANEALAQEQLAADQQRYYYPQTAQWDMLNQYGALLNGLPQMQTGTQTSNGPGPNRAMGAMGGALSGAQMGSAFGPWGAAGGAVLGGLFGGYAA